MYPLWERIHHFPWWLSWSKWFRNIDPDPDHCKGQEQDKSLSRVSRSLEWHHKFPTISRALIRLINVFLYSYLVLHYIWNFVTRQAVIEISAIFQIFANLTSHWLKGIQIYCLTTFAGYILLRETLGWSVLLREYSTCSLAASTPWLN